MSSPGDNDYVPGAVDEELDYTAQDRAAIAAGNPLGSTSHSVDDDEGFTTEFRSDITPEDIEKSSFRYIGPGEHTVYVKDVQWMEDKKFVSQKMYVKQPNGEVRPMAMDCQKIKVIFALPGDENCTASCTFFMPPAPNQMDAFEYGYKEPEDALKNPREKGGFHAKNLKYFLGRLFVFDSSGKIPAAAGKFANWKKYPGTNIHKLIGITVEKGKAGKYTDKKTGEEKESKGFNNVKYFSYRLIPTPPEVLVAQKQAELERTKALAASVAKSSEPVQEQAEASEAHEEKPKKSGKKVAASA